MALHTVAWREREQFFISVALHTLAWRESRRCGTPIQRHRYQRRLGNKDFEFTHYLLILAGSFGVEHDAYIHSADHGFTAHLLASGFIQPSFNVHVACCRFRIWCTGFGVRLWQCRKHLCFWRGCPAAVLGTICITDKFEGCCHVLIIEVNCVIKKQH